MQYHVGGAAGCVPLSVSSAVCGGAHLRRSAFHFLCLARLAAVERPATDRLEEVQDGPKTRQSEQNMYNHALFLSVHSTVEVVKVASCLA